MYLYSLPEKNGARARETKEERIAQHMTNVANSRTWPSDHTHRTPYVASSVRNQNYELGPSRNRRHGNAVSVRGLDMSGRVHEVHGTHYMIEDLLPRPLYGIATCSNFCCIFSR